MMGRVHTQLNPAAQDYFRKSREAQFKKPLEQVCTPDTAPAMWKAVEHAWARLDGFAGRHGPFLTGERMTFADIDMAGWLVWVKRISVQ